MLMFFIAIIIFYTRLPFWRHVDVPQKYFKNIIYSWSMAGWLTASVMAGTLFLSSLFLPASVAVVLAIISRVLLTGALHEDGLADFFDGFGGGSSRERILAIMKDSHTGSYGVLGLILYYLLFFSLLSSIPIKAACIAILAGDPFCKGVSTLITARLAYAREGEESKIKTIYNRIDFSHLLLTAVFALIPFMLLLPVSFYCVGILPVLVFLLLTLFMQKKIRGYTGDCVGAMFLLTELSFYFAFVARCQLI